MFDNPQQGPKNNTTLWMLMGLALVALGISDYMARQKAAATPAAPPAVEAPAQPQPAAQGATQAPAQPVGSITLENPLVRATLRLDGTLSSLTLLQESATVNGPKGLALLGPDAEMPQSLFSGWRAQGVETPGAALPWRVTAQTSTSVVLAATNATGQTFSRTLALAPTGYAWTETDSVTNNAALPLALTHVAKLERQGALPPHARSNWVNFFGPMGQTREGDKTLLTEDSYGSVKKEGRSAVQTGTGGWWGFTEQYFMAAILPPAGQATQRQFGVTLPVGATADVTPTFDATVAQSLNVAPGQTASVQNTLFVGPKEAAALNPLGLQDAISWGWFKPIVKLLHTVLVGLHGALGNWGLAILVLTLLLKILLFPLAHKSYSSMAKLKNLQPHVEKLKEVHGEDQQRMASEMMALYAREKVSPLGGCWPMIIQIPIFFAMYKVVLLSFELRHAPLVFWIHDLSVRDPYYVLPVLMGISMWGQQKFNPPPTDETQKMVFQAMPVVFTVMMISFPAGLVFYWLVNNLLSIAQQAMVKRAMSQ